MHARDDASVRASFLSLHAVTLAGTDLFKGLLVQARLMADLTTPVGTFTPIPGGVVKLSACTINAVSYLACACMYMYNCVDL